MNRIEHIVAATKLTLQQHFLPAIVDTDGPGGHSVRVFDSTAILLYLAEKTGCFLPRDLRGRQMVRVKHCAEQLEVSRGNTHLFQQM